MDYLPIAEEQRIQKSYPGLLNYLNQKSPKTMAESATYLGEYMRDHGINIERAIDEVAPVFFNYIWRKHRIIYHFNDALVASFAEQVKRIDESETVPCELLSNLPYPCIAVEINQFSIAAVDRQTKSQAYKINFSGRFYLMYEPENIIYNFPILHGLFEMSDGELADYYMPVIPEGTVKDSISALYDYISSYSNNVSIDDAKTEMTASLLAMQVVLYLQSQNADIKKPPKSNKSKRKYTKNNTISNVSNPEIIRVGYRVGRILREYESYDSKSTETGSKKRPHSRRGHWHHYWIGSKSNPDDRKLIVKWVAPTIIHKDNDNNTTTIVDVKD